jgi:uncharacterized protein YhbP (UPF0306 family)
MSLATSADNKPWVCEVHFAYDDELNLYFQSLKSRRHSQEIAKNPNVAGNIVTQHPAGQKPRGVYFEGTAEIVENVDENHPAYTSLNKRFGMGPKIIQEADSDEGHKFYKIKPSMFVLFDTVNFPENSRQEWSLK